MVTKASRSRSSVRLLLAWMVFAAQSQVPRSASYPIRDCALLARCRRLSGRVHGHGNVKVRAVVLLPCAARIEAVKRCRHTLKDRGWFSAPAHMMPRRGFCHWGIGLDMSSAMTWTVTAIRPIDYTCRLEQQTMLNLQYIANLSRDRRQCLGPDVYQPRI